MSDDIFEAFETAGRHEGAAIGSRLRSDEARTTLLAEVGRARRRHGRVQAGIATMAVALVGLGLTWALPRVFDQQPAVIEEDVPLIEAGAFVCGEEPVALPDPALYAAEPEEAPALDLVLFTRFQDGAGAMTEAVVGAVDVETVDPRSALGFAFQVLWGEVEEPRDWGVYTAAAVLDRDRSVVAVHDGLTVRGDVMEPAEQRRAEEGLLSFAECGDEAPGGDYTVRTVVQIWVGAVPRITATYVVDSGPVTFEESEGVVALTDDDHSRTVAGPETDARIAEEGAALVDAGLGYRASPGGVAARDRGETLLCERAGIAASGLASIDVLPFEMEPLAVEMGLVKQPDGAYAFELGFAFPVDDYDDLWMISATPDALLLFDEAGSLVAALAGSAQLFTNETDQGDLAFNYFADGDGCDVPAEMPTTPGRYSAVYVWSPVGWLPEAVPTATILTDDALDAWYLLPDLVVGEDGEVQELPVEATGEGWILIG